MSASAEERLIELLDEAIRLVDELAPWDATIKFAHTLANATAKILGNTVGCDACDRDFTADVLDFVGQPYVQCDSNGDPDVAICRDCAEESRASR